MKFTTKPKNATPCDYAFYIRIHAAEANKENTESNIVHDCTAEELYANYSDRCDITFTVYDPYMNIITKNSDLSIAPIGQDTEGSYDVIETEGENYLNGIRFNGGIKTMANTSSNGRVQTVVLNHS